jgi:hypothetical protein
VSDAWTIPELTRALIDFRTEMRDEIKWLRRLLIGTLVSAVAGSLISSIFVLVKGP